MLVSTEVVLAGSVWHWGVLLLPAGRVGLGGKSLTGVSPLPDPEGSKQDGEANQILGVQITQGDAYPENGSVLESIGHGGSAKDSRLVSEEECFVATEVVLAGSVSDTGLMLVFSVTCNNGGDKAEEGEGGATEMKPKPSEP